MLSRWLTLGLPLLVGSLCGCENQGFGTRVDAIEQICAYNVEAIQQLGCLNHTLETGVAVDPAILEPADQSEYFRLTCLQTHRIVAPRCANEQRELAQCMVDTFKPLTNPTDRAAKFNSSYSCEMKEVTMSDGTKATKENGNAISLTGGAVCIDAVAKLTKCAATPPSYAP